MAESAGEGPTLQLLFTEGWEAQKKMEDGKISAGEKKVSLPPTYHLLCLL